MLLFAGLFDRVISIEYLPSPAETGEHGLEYGRLLLLLGDAGLDGGELVQLGPQLAHLLVVHLLVEQTLRADALQQLLLVLLLLEEGLHTQF